MSKCRYVSMYQGTCWSTGVGKEGWVLHQQKVHPGWVPTAARSPAAPVPALFLLFFFLLTLFLFFLFPSPSVPSHSWFANSFHLPPRACDSRSHKKQMCKPSSSAFGLGADRSTAGHASSDAALRSCFIHTKIPGLIGRGPNKRSALPNLVSRRACVCNE